MELGLEDVERGSVGAPQWNTNDTQNQAALPRKGKAREVSTSSLPFDHRSLTLSLLRNGTILLSTGQDPGVMSEKIRMPCDPCQSGTLSVLIY